MRKQSPWGPRSSESSIWMAGTMERCTWVGWPDPQSSEATTEPPSSWGRTTRPRSFTCHPPGPRRPRLQYPQGKSTHCPHASAQHPGLEGTLGTVTQTTLASLGCVLWLSPPLHSLYRLPRTAFTSCRPASHSLEHRLWHCHSSPRTLSTCDLFCYHMDQFLSSFPGAVCVCVRGSGRRHLRDPGGRGDREQQCFLRLVPSPVGISEGSRDQQAAVPCLLELQPPPPPRQLGSQLGWALHSISLLL